MLIQIDTVISTIREILSRYGEQDLSYRRDDKQQATFFNHRITSVKIT
jgi:hypothetical protein